MTAFILLTHNVKVYVADVNNNLIFASDTIEPHKILSGADLDALYVIGSFSSVLSGEDAALIGKQLVNGVETSLFMLKSDLAYIATLHKISGAKKCEIYSIIDFYASLVPSGVAVDYGSDLNLARVVVSNNGKVLSSIELPLESLKETLSSVANLNVKFIELTDPVQTFLTFVNSSDAKMYIDTEKQTFTLASNGETSSSEDNLVNIDSTEEGIDSENTNEVLLEKKTKGIFGNKKADKASKGIRRNKTVGAKEKVEDLDLDELSDSPNKAANKGAKGLTRNKKTLDENEEQSLAETKNKKSKDSSLKKEKKSKSAPKSLARNRRKLDLDDDIDKLSSSNVPSDSNNYRDDIDDGMPVDLSGAQHGMTVRKLIIIGIIVFSVILAIVAALVVGRVFIAPGRVAIMQSNVQLMQGNIGKLSYIIDAIDDSELWITATEFAEIVGALDAADHSLVSADLIYGEVEATIFVADTNKYQYIYGLLVSVIEEEYISAVLVNDTVNGQTYEISITRR